VAPPGTVDMGPKLGLPPLPARDLMLYANVSEPWAKTAVRALTAAIKSTASP
jgi:hypothetical protein